MPDSPDRAARSPNVAVRLSAATGERCMRETDHTGAHRFASDDLETAIAEALPQEPDEVMTKAAYNRLYRNSYTTPTIVRAAVQLALRAHNQHVAATVRQMVEAGAMAAHTEGRIHKTLGEQLRPGDEISRYMPIVWAAALKAAKEERFDAR